MSNRNLNWIANQPTPFHYYFHSIVKKSGIFKFSVFFTINDYNLLPFTDKSYDKEDVFLKNLSFSQKMQYFLNAATSNDQYIIAGWNNFYLILTLLLRFLFTKPFCLYTDSIILEKQKRGFKHFIKKLLLSKASFILTTGNFGVDNMKRSGLVNSQDKILNLPFFIRPTESRVDLNLNRYKQVNKFLILARLIPLKGISVAFRALFILKERGISNIEIHIGGIGPELDSLTTLAEQYNITSQIVFCGWLNEQEKFNLMSESIALLHPVTGNDAFPLVINESLDFGLPVIGTKNSGSVSDFVVDDFNGYIVEPNSAEDLSNSMLKILHLSDNDYVNMCNNARKITTQCSTEYGISILEKITNL